jgi:hypothetical protein
MSPPALLALVLLVACQSATGGPLDPVAGPGVERESDERWSHAAVLSGGDGLSARVVGRWSARRAQTVRITYRNSGTAPVAIRLRDLKLTHPLGEAALWTAVDATGTDMTDATEANDTPRILYKVDDPATHAATLAVPAGETRELDTELTSFANEGEVASGDRIQGMIPMGTRMVTVTFTAGS